MQRRGRLPLLQPGGQVVVRTASTKSTRKSAGGHTPGHPHHDREQVLTGPQRRRHQPVQRPVVRAPPAPAADSSTSSAPDRHRPVAPAPAAPTAAALRPARRAQQPAADPRRTRAAGAAAARRRGAPGVDRGHHRDPHRAGPQRPQPPRVREGQHPPDQHRHQATSGLNSAAVTAIRAQRSPIGKTTSA